MIGIMSLERMVFHQFIKPINKLLSFQQAGKEIYPAFRISIRLLNCAVFKYKSSYIWARSISPTRLSKRSCICCKQGNKIPGSLKNIYKEIQDDIGDCVYSSGNLEQWAAQGVLLLNSSLTVNKSKLGLIKVLVGIF